MLLPSSPSPAINLGFPSVKRSLFGPVDHEETARLLEKELVAQYQQDTKRWNFNFIDGVPLEGRFVWTPVSVPATDARVLRTARARESRYGNAERMHRSRPIDSPSSCCAEPALNSVPAVDVALRSPAIYNEPIPPLTRPEALKRARHVATEVMDDCILAPTSQFLPNLKKPKMMGEQLEEALRLTAFEASQPEQPLGTKESRSLALKPDVVAQDSSPGSFPLSSSLTLNQNSNQQRKITDYMKAQKSTTQPSKQQ